MRPCRCGRELRAGDTGRRAEQRLRRLPAERPHHGLEIVFDSNRSDTLGGQDLYSATRESIDDPWSTPVNLGTLVNTAANETRGSFWRGETLYFGRSPGAEGPDGHLRDHAWEARRTLIEICEASADLRVRRRASCTR